MSGFDSTGLTCTEMTADINDLPLTNKQNERITANISYDNYPEQELSNQYVKYCSPSEYLDI